MKKLSKLLSVLLAAGIITASMPVSVPADEVDSGISGPEEQTEETSSENLEESSESSEVSSVVPEEQTDVNSKEADDGEAYVNRYDFSDYEYLKDMTYVTYDGREASLQDAVDEILADADSYLEELDVSEYDQDAVNEDLRYQLCRAQDITEGRILGDHGILHVVTNWEKARHYLDTRSDVTADIYFAVLLAEVYHDTGYEVRPCNLKMSSSDYNDYVHDTLSGTILEADDTYDIYEGILSEDIMDRVLYAISTHNSSDPETAAGNTSSDSDVIAVAINLSDKTSMSLRDKIPSIFLNYPELMDLLFDYVMNMPEDAGDDYNNEFIAAFSEALDYYGIDSEQLEDYTYISENEISLKQYKYLAIMFMSYVSEDCISYNEETGSNDVVLYRVSYGTEVEKTYQEKELSRFIKDCVPIAEGESEDDYDQKISGIYAAACEEGGTDIDDRGLHLTIKEIIAHDIPGSGYDYLSPGLLYLQ